MNYKKGAHFNFEDSRSGEKIVRAIPLPGGLTAAEAFIATLNSIENLTALLELLKKKALDDAFEKAHPQKAQQYAEWETLLNNKLPKTQS